MNYSLIIILALVFAAVTVFSIVLHEFCHFLISKIQGYKILAVSIFCFTLARKRLILKYEEGILGGVWTDFSTVDSEEGRKAFERNFKNNVLATYLTGLFTVILASVICVFCRNYYTYTITGTLAFTNLALFISSFYKNGDFDLFFRLGKDYAVSIGFIAYSEGFTGFKNNYIFEKAVNCLKDFETDEEIFLILADYYIDYCLYYGVDIENEVLRALKKRYSDEPVYNFLLEKFYLWTVLYSVEDPSILGGEYADYIKKIVNKEKINNKDLKLEINLKMYRCFPEYVKFENDIFKKISNLP